MSQTRSRQLDYAPPPRSRRYRAILALILSAMAVGIVGMLCWDKFAGPVKEHLDRLNLQKIVLRVRAAACDEPPPKSGQPALEVLSDISDLMLDWTSPHPLSRVIYHGPIGPQGSTRFARVALNHSDTEPIQSETIILRVFSEGSLFAPIRETVPPQILPFLTFRSTYHIDPPTISPTNPSLLIITGTRDGVPFRYELLLDGDDKVHLVEDTSIATTRPLSATSTQRNGNNTKQ